MTLAGESPPAGPTAAARAAPRPRQGRHSGRVQGDQRDARTQLRDQPRRRRTRKGATARQRGGRLLDRSAEEPTEREDEEEREMITTISGVLILRGRIRRMDATPWTVVGAAIAILVAIATAFRSLRALINGRSVLLVGSGTKSMLRSGIDSYARADGQARRPARSHHRKAGGLTSAGPGFAPATRRSWCSRSCGRLQASRLPTCNHPPGQPPA